MITPTVPIPTSSPSEHVRRARELLGPDKLLAPELAVVLEPDPGEARRLARLHTGSFYLSAANYVRSLRWLGWSDADFADGGSDALVDAIVAWGDEQAIARRVGEYLAAGADHVCVQPVTAIRPLVDGPDTAALDVLRRLAPVLTAPDLSRAGRDTAAETIYDRGGVDGEGGLGVTIIVESPEFAELVDPDARMTEIGSGYQFSEGPVWDVRDEALLFSDIPGDARWRWTPERGMERVAWPTLKGNGLAFDLDGSLLVCEQLTSCVSRVHRDGLHELVAWHHQGTYLNSPNDVVVRSSDGSIYFTDPDYGRWNDWIGCKREFVCDVKGVYRVLPDAGDTELVVGPDEFEQPNGLCFAPDESLLYVNDSPRGEIKVYDVAADGIAGELPDVPRQDR